MTAYPPAPWRMHGSMWLSVLRLGRAADERHPAGTYGVALVDYREPSPLTYGELLVARTTRNRAGERAVTITDIWVDSTMALCAADVRRMELLLKAQSRRADRESVASTKAALEV